MKSVATAGPMIGGTSRAPRWTAHAQLEESVARYLQQLDTADRQEPSEALKTKTSRLNEKIEKLKEEMQRLNSRA